MDISIFGLGYVGCVSIGCLSKLGHNLTGVDVSPVKVDLINSGKSTIVENKIEELIQKGFEAKKIRATSDTIEAIKSSDAAIICVGTPNSEAGHLNMEFIYMVAKQIGKGLRNKDTFFTVLIRSTVLPGTNRKVAELIENESGKVNDKDFAVVSNPEFLREGSAVDDFFNPPYSILASDSEKGLEQAKEIYKEISGDKLVVDIDTAELIKFLNNSYHALKVAFANEIGRICKLLNTDSRVLMDLFVKDKSLNISEKYFKPGFAYGGSCLPKDLKALNLIAHDGYTSTPILKSIAESNSNHITYALDLINSKSNNKTIGIYGLAFKSGTDDLRFSPALNITEDLIGKGKKVRVFDENVIVSKLLGKNKEYLFNHLPHIDNILEESLDSFLVSSEVIVLINKGEHLDSLLGSDLSQKTIIDFIGIDKIKNKCKEYIGLCW